MKTQKEIDKEVETLTKLKPKIAPRSLFGDDNHAAVQAQIDVLKGDMTETQIYAAYEKDDDNCIYVLDSALEAYHWRRDKDKDAPSADWEGLVK